MDGLLGKSAAHKHANTHDHFHKLLTFLRSEPPVRRAWIKLQKIAGLDEKQLDHWLVSSNCAEWRFLPERKLWLKLRLWPSTLGGRQEELFSSLRWHTAHSRWARWRIIYVKYVQIDDYWWESHAGIGWIYTLNIFFFLGLTHRFGDRGWSLWCIGVTTEVIITSTNVGNVWNLHQQERIPNSTQTHPEHHKGKVFLDLT